MHSVPSHTAHCGMNEVYRIESSAKKGDFVVANKLILCGEPVSLNEVPLVWHRVTCIAGQHFHKSCEECGLVIYSEMFEEMLSELRAKHVDNYADIIFFMKELFPSPGDDIQIKCPQDACDHAYCSQACMDLAAFKGHAWLCDCYQHSHHQPTSGSSRYQQQHRLSDFNDEKGHFGLASKVYARIAEETRRHLVSSPYTVDIAWEAVAVAEKLLAAYHTEDFAMAMHVHRTGRLEVDPEMFQSLLFPAYFSAHLAAPLALTKDVFAQSGPVLWSNNGLVSSVEGLERSQAFLSSPIFSEQFYSRILGTFVVNCLSVYVPSPLDYILAQALALQAQAHAGDGDGMDSIKTDAINFLQGKLLSQQQARPYYQQEDEERGDGEDAGNFPHARFLGMSATGLFPFFSKANHSCLCNTSNHGSDRVSVSVVATEDIQMGHEITSCYIHHNSLNLNDSNKASSHANRYGEGAGRGALGRKGNRQHVLNAQLTKKQRYRALRQYVFACDCELCAVQTIDSDEESD
ncbi:SET domain-containing protein-lysine N-methyltransferase [archaeon]|nr:MAG: SET domain-containing protein-lysine N-methyltransferase [archaeon]